MESDDGGFHFDFCSDGVCVPEKLEAEAEPKQSAGPATKSAALPALARSEASRKSLDSAGVGDNDDEDLLPAASDEEEDSDAASERPELDEEEEVEEAEPPEAGEDAEEAAETQATQATQAMQALDRPAKRSRRHLCGGDEELEVKVALPEEYPQDAWPPTKLKPGDAGFNAYAADAQSKVLKFWKDRSLRGGHELYQQTAEAVCHPWSPVRRILCDARMGTGKTKMLLTILDQHFFDPRKKLPLVPKREQLKNLYDQLLIWPTRYRSYFALVQPRLAARAVPLKQFADVEEVADLDELRRALEAVAQDKWEVPSNCADEMRKALMTELKMNDVRSEDGKRIVAVNRGRLTRTYRRWFSESFPGKRDFMPGAPLRAMLLMTAGGNGYLGMTEDATPRPRNPMAQFGYSCASKNPFDNSIVLIDEAHNLAKGSKAAQEAHRQCRRLKFHLAAAQNTSLVCFTGTPVPDNPKIKLPKLKDFLDGQREDLVGIVQGRSPAVLAMLAGIAEFAGTSIVCVDLLFQGLERRLVAPRSLEGFVTSYHGPLPGATARMMNSEPSELVEAALDRKIELPAVMAMRYDIKHREKKGGRRELQTYVNLDVANSCMAQDKFRNRALADPETYTPKLHWLAEQIVESDRKAVVLVKKNTGFAYFKRLLEQVRDDAGEDFKIADLSQRSLFNCRETNCRGERYRVLLGEFAESFEGTSFFDVRDLYIADVPLNATEFQQVKARVDRADGHRGLPPSERTVKVHLVCGALPESLNGSAIAAYLWRGVVGAQGQASKKPLEWEKLLSKVDDVVNLCSTELNLDAEEDTALEELWDHVRSCDDEDDDFMQAVKKHKPVDKIVKKLGNMSEAIFHKMQKSLCLRTVDEELCEELAGRCGYVLRAHKPLKSAAMDRPLLKHLLE